MPSSLFGKIPTGQCQETIQHDSARRTRSLCATSASSAACLCVAIVWCLELHSHAPIIAMEVVTAELQKSVQQKTDCLQMERLPKVQSVLTAVDRALTQLSTRADRVCSEIDTVEREVVNTLKAAFHQKRLEVKDIEAKRSKALSEQHDRLESYFESMKSCVAFGKKLAKLDGRCGDFTHLLSITDSCADALCKAQEEDPAEHAAITYVSASNDVVLMK